MPPLLLDQGAQYQPLRSVAATLVQTANTVSKVNYDRLNDISIMLPLMKAITVLVLVPVILILIFRTERKFVKHEYQMKEARKAVVNLNK